MLGFLILVELDLSCLILSAIAWLRHLTGRNDLRSVEARYLLPILGPVIFVILLSYDLERPLPATTSNVGILVVVSIGFALLVLWLLVEVSRYPTRRRRFTRSLRFRDRSRKVH